jgi:hypothetical protein
MKLAIKAYLVTLILLTLVFAVSAQQRSELDDRNQAPTVGTGGPVGGPTGLFTVYDGSTLRKGEYTFSGAISNYDRDPGDIDITSVPLSFQVGVTNHLELFFTTEGYRGVKVNSPRNLSGFYLPNSQLFINGAFQSPPAIVLAPNGGGPNPFFGQAIFRPTGSAGFVPFPFIGGNAGTFGLQFPFFSGPQFGFPAGTNALIGPAFQGGASVGAFPGLGSVYGSILPGIVFSTQPLINLNGDPSGEGPLGFTLAPAYNPDVPFINRTWGTSSFNSMDFGFKWRWNNNESPIGYGLIGSYRWYLDTADSPSGFNMMQRGAGPGANKGDINLTFFADARLSKYINMSGNVGYTFTTDPEGSVGGTDVTILGRPDELMASVGVDIPANKYLQPIFEFRSLYYVGGHTPNAFDRNVIDGLAGIRIFPRRWWGIGLAYRINFNQQNERSFDDENTPHTATVIFPCLPGVPDCEPTTITNTFTGVPPGFRTSSDPHGFIGQFWIGHRHPRLAEIPNLPANVNSVTLSDMTITLPCAPGTRSRSGGCNDSTTINIATSASDPENDVLTYNYTVSGGRIIGTGANVQWDVTGMAPGTYTVTTGVDDGCGVCGRTDTKTITVEACPDCGPVCACPTVTITGPPDVTSPGNTMTFTANVSGMDVTYNWSVSDGTIESGQGTSSITVRTTLAMAGGNVTATLNIGGTDPACSCTTQFTETAPVAPNPQSVVVDEFGPQNPDQIKARVDNFYIQLNNNPNSRGFIINYGTPAQIKARKAQIDKAIAFRKYDKSRVTYVDGPDTGEGIKTKFILTPPGAADPTP